MRHLYIVPNCTALIITKIILQYKYRMSTIINDLGEILSAVAKMHMNSVAVIEKRKRNFFSCSQNVF